MSVIRQAIDSIEALRDVAQREADSFQVCSLEDEMALSRVRGALRDINEMRRELGIMQDMEIDCFK